VTNSTIAQLGGRVLALIGAAVAIVTLPLPWAVQYREGAENPPDQWSGWNLHGASHLDGHRPVSLATVILFVAGSVALLILTWYAFERPAARWTAYAGFGLALILLILSFVLVSGVPSNRGVSDRVELTYGIEIWRLALIATMLGAARWGVLQEREKQG
jgi:hypothetical protein